jgi:hypothetical protein
MLTTSTTRLKQKNDDDKATVVKNIIEIQYKREMRNFYVPNQRESRSNHCVGTAFTCCYKADDEFDADSDANAAANVDADEDVDAEPADASRYI